MKTNQFTESSNWYKNTIKDFMSNGKILEKSGVGKITRSPKIGRMYSMYYDPKLKDTLPYYDTFPLVFFIESYKDSLLGLNLHYLPPSLRKVLFDKLITLNQDKNITESSKLKLNYDLLNSSSKFKLFEPTIKKYLNSHIRSNFLDIFPPFWEKIINLPLQSFRKANDRKVWNDSRNKI